MSRRENVWNNIWGIDTQARNRFDTYKPSFNIESMRGALDKLYDTQRENIAGTFNRDTNKRMAQARKGMGSRLLSQGITGGSMMNDMISGAEEDVIESGYEGLSNALASLGIGRMSQELPLMQYGNEFDFRTTQAAQNVDLQNIINQMRKMGMLQGAVNDWEEMDMARDAQPGFLDDLFAGIGAAADIASIVAAIPTGGASLALNAGIKGLSAIPGAGLKSKVPTSLKPVNVPNKPTLWG